jgi:SAM-dependent methyltransferase
MTEALRRAWTETVEPADYEAHMARNGQAAAMARLVEWALEETALDPGASIWIAGAGSGQMFDFLDPHRFAPFALTCTDLSERMLAALRQRVARLGLGVHVEVDDLENCAVEGLFDLSLATLVLEHVDWRRAVVAIGQRSRETQFYVVQENPPGMATAVTPGCIPPGTMRVFAEEARPHLLSFEELTQELGARDFILTASRREPVADGKQLRGLLFRR